jgi:hypothetical protein
MAAGLGLIASGADVNLLAVVDLLYDAVECGGGDEQDRYRGLACASENRMQGFSRQFHNGDLVSATGPEYKLTSR